MSIKRKSYPVEYKKETVEDSRDENLTNFCTEKMLDLQMVRKWRSDYDNFCRQVDHGNVKKGKCGSGRKPVFIELEDIIPEWITDRRAKSYFVRWADIQGLPLQWHCNWIYQEKILKHHNTGWITIFKDMNWPSEDQ